MVCAKPGGRTRLIYRMLVHHPGLRGEKNGFEEQDFAELLEAAHQQPGGKIVLVQDKCAVRRFVVSPTHPGGR